MAAKTTAQAVLTVQGVQDRLDRIRGLASGQIASPSSDEAAHEAQDALLFDALRAIASGQASDPVALAQMALSVESVPFSRWYS